MVDSHEVLARYLLGDLSDPEREQLEKEYFTNDGAWESLIAVENELIDSYIRGRLSDRQQKQFQQYFLQSPRRRERFEFDRLLMDPTLRQTPEAASPSPTERKLRASWLGIFKRIPAPQMLTAAIILMLAAGAFLAFQNHRLTVQLQRMQSEQTTLQTEIRNLRESATHASSPQKEQANEILGITQIPVISILLEPGNLRAAGSGNVHQLPRLTMPASIVLALDLARDEYPLYTIKLQTADGHAVREVIGQRSQPIEGGGRAVLLKFPSAVLPKGDYIAWLFGEAGNRKLQSIDSYVFSVVE